ncbi:MAG: protein-glutamate O-methyltransferase CheR, partial [bacterium]|nr:protein-glutamate O-methyltransferase CheR [bacterium]
RKESKKALVHNRLQKRLAACGLTSLRAYLDLLNRDPEGRSELAGFVDALTTNETFFFRHPEHFELLVDDLIPRIIERKTASGSGRRIRIWSAACSSGEEPYTAAMVLHQNAERFRGWAFEIIGTDINRSVLEKARSGLYTSYAVSKMPDAYRRRYFTADPAAGTFRLKDEIRQLVRFHAANLLQPFSFGKFDVIFCRNVMIYFDAASKETALHHLHGSLFPGGTLIVGYAESMLNHHDRFRYIMPTVYQREDSTHGEGIRGKT